MIKDIASLCRLPNLPTVWSNITCAYLLALELAGRALAGTRVAPSFDAADLALVLLSGTLLYLHGTFLNDALDAVVDGKTRPDRPIPAGRIGRDTVLNLSLLFGLGGLAAVFPLGRLALATTAPLLVSVLLYTWLHKKHAWSMVFMAMCRALLVPLGAVAALPWWGKELHATAGWLAAAALLLFFYTLGVSLAARGEAADKAHPKAALVARVFWSLPFFLPVAALLWLFTVEPDAKGWQAGLAAGVVGSLGLGWVWFAAAGARRSVATMVGRALPGLALVDVVSAIPVWNRNPALIAVPLGAFLLALLLRRVASAT